MENLGYVSEIPWRSILKPWPPNQCRFTSYLPVAYFLGKESTGNEEAFDYREITGLVRNCKSLVSLGFLLLIV
jgi:hypothetical protein